MKQKLKREKGITLVALVITIIVLLILAGVTLAMVMGDSGIFGKANSAKEQTQLKTAEDTIKLAVLDNRTLRETGDTSALSNKNLKVSIAEKLRDLGYNVAEDNNIVTYYEEKTIKIEDYLGKEDNQGGITAQEIKDNPELYYGKEVNYTSANGQNDWKIFHSDGTNIYLITGNYVIVTKQDEQGNTLLNDNGKPIIDTEKLSENTKMIMAGGGKKYKVIWNNGNYPSFNTDIPDSTFEKFKVDKSIYNINEHKDFSNAKAVASLLNTSNWEQYIDSSKGSGQYAIGGPTLELWIESWNNRYKDPSDKLYCNNSSGFGYYIGSDSTQKGTNITLNSNMGNGGELYFSNNHSALLDGQSNVSYYWLAAPNASDYGANFGVYYNATIYGRMVYTGSEFGGLRPVVCLQSNVSLK